MTVTGSDLQLHTRRDFRDEEVESRILAALKEMKGEVTLADLIAHTGLNGPQIDPVLRSMILRYDVTLRVSEDGDIAYAFDPALTPTDGDERMRRFRLRQKLWAAFKVFYKVLIVVVLVGYVIAFMVLMLMAFFAAQNQREEQRGGGRSSNHGGGGMGGNFWFWYWMMGNRRQPAPRRSRYDAPPRDREDPRPLWEKVFSFVFGLDTSDDDPLVDRKAMLAYLVQQKGVVAPTELSAHTGWSPDASEQESSRLIAAFDGGVEILPDGQTLFIFDDLRQAVPPGTRPLPRFYKRFERRKSNSGNPVTTDLIIGALNLFVLFSSLYLAPTTIIPALMESYGVQNLQLLQILLMWIPGLFSITFFAIPMIRGRFTTRKENEARKARNARRVIMRSVYRAIEGGRPTFTESEILEDALRFRLRSDEAIFAQDREGALTDALRTMAHEWRAGQDVDSNGERVYDFSHVAEQFRHAERARTRDDRTASHRLDEEFERFDEALAESAPAP